MSAITPDTLCECDHALKEHSPREGRPCSMFACRGICREFRPKGGSVKPRASKADKVARPTAPKSKKIAPTDDEAWKAAYLGATGRVPMIDDLEFEVHVIDAKRAFGRIDLNVTPITGQGSTWVRLSSLSEFKAPKGAK